MIASSQWPSNRLTALASIVQIGLLMLGIISIMTLLISIQQIAELKGQCVGIEAVQFSVISLPVKSSIIGVIQEFTINENGFPFRVLNRSAGPGQNNPSSSWSS